MNDTKKETQDNANSVPLQGLGVNSPLGAGGSKKSAKILVFSTEKISDPAIDMAGLLKMHYPPTVYTISIPCSSGIKPSWILYAYE